jgi:hypothetical protein
MHYAKRKIQITKEMNLLCNVQLICELQVKIMQMNN